MAFRGHIQRTTGGTTLRLRVHSQPGEPPRKQTGRLRQSVAWEFDARRMTARAGTNLKYGKFLELGTVKMAPRPWIRATLKREAATLGRIMAQGS